MRSKTFSYLAALAVGLVEAPAQTFSILHTFSATSWNGTNLPSGAQAYTNSDGANPESVLVSSGNVLYGTASDGGNAACGTVFKLNIDGSGFSVLHSFTGKNADGAFPMGGLVLSSNTLFGTTYNGGSNYSGTVFKVNTDGTGFSTLHNFAATSPAYPYLTLTNGDGAFPTSALVVSNGTLYGTAPRGGTSGHGTVFKVNTNGTDFAVLHTFNGIDGAEVVAGLALAGNVLYGTAEFGGTNGDGTVFKLNTDGTGFVVLHNFSGGAGDGAQPRAALALGDTTLYGTTFAGGDFRINTDGSGFAEYKVGASMVGGLTLVGSTLYGAAGSTVFKFNTDGSGFGTLYTFSGNADAYGGLCFVGNTLYGTTLSSSPDNGTIYSVGVAAPFSIPLIARSLNGAIILSWTNSSFLLQAAPALTVAYTNIPGATSPRTNALTDLQMFFRLLAN
jgi:uncharacterized repeat protein (TIGR03803 family)